ncbi:MAG: hypothetical protein EBS86_08265 [Crocinitomicaceae bacterium]|nr:hypothetical protein [Crocinitomicaceae bacterium]
MKFPNRNNIDRWMFDYTEGNLSPEQETLLENYILNNPDLEVDLDAWQLATVSTEKLIYTEKEKAFKKRRMLPFIFGGVAAMLLLLFGIWSVINTQNTVSTKNVVTDSKTNINSTETNSEQKSTSNTDNATFENPSVLEESRNSNTFVSQNGTVNFNQNSQFSVNQLNSNQTTLSTSSIENTNLPTNSILVPSTNNDNLENLSNLNRYDKSEFSRLNLRSLNSYILDGYQVRDQELIEENVSEAEKDGISMRTPKLLNKIERVLSKDVALTNVPDHVYALPEKSDVDVLFSNIGATSKARFYSTTRARWLGNENQQKFSQQFSFDTYSRGAKSAFGLQANYDYFATGVIQNWNTALLFSPKISISRNITFEPAVRFKMGNKILDRNKITNNSATEFETGNVQTFNFDSSAAIGRKLWYRDLDLGFTINTSLFYIGFQANNILKHYDNIYTNSNSTVGMTAMPTYNIVAGTQYISRNEKFVLSPYVYVDMNRINKTIYGGFSMKLAGFMIGGSYGSNDAMTGLIGLSAKKFSLFAQTTYAPSTILSSNALTHQLTLRFNSSTSRKARRYITL